MARMLGHWSKLSSSGIVRRLLGLERMPYSLDLGIFRILLLSFGIAGATWALPPAPKMRGGAWRPHGTVPERVFKKNSKEGINNAKTVVSKRREGALIFVIDRARSDESIYVHIVLGNRDGASTCIPCMYSAQYRHGRA